MRPLQRWLDEPDGSIARLAPWFYVLALAFLAFFAVQVALLLLRGDEPLRARDVASPLVLLLLALTFHTLAVDGRRSHKALKAAQEKAPGR